MLREGVVSQPISHLSEVVGEGVSRVRRVLKISSKLCGGERFLATVLKYTVPHDLICLKYAYGGTHSRHS
jgi:hypothetical protein